ncbi:uncharacterized protein LOC143569890 isoform X1 [Bidens hawaiensis]|uniref:uncharacterized protein LOC143569890 isoform X1 n=1 Tax=Bidens hawaiensis TaxID=980011 RepID=UPI00404A8EA1
MKLVRNSYKENTINEMVYGNIKDEIDHESLFAFATIAYQCLEIEREKRPLMSEILEALKKALHYQESRNDQVEDHTKRQVTNKLPRYPYLNCKQKDCTKAAIGMASNSKNEDGGWLVVTVHEGVNLQLEHPRVMLAIGTDSAFTTIKYDNLNLVWEESFRFTLKKPQEEILILTVYSA